MPVSAPSDKRFRRAHVSPRKRTWLRLPAFSSSPAANRGRQTQRPQNPVRPISNIRSTSR